MNISDEQKDEVSIQTNNLELDSEEKTVLIFDSKNKSKYLDNPQKLFELNENYQIIEPKLRNLEIVKTEENLIDPYNLENEDESNIIIKELTNDSTEIITPEERLKKHKKILESPLIKQRIENWKNQSIESIVTVKGMRYPKNTDATGEINSLMDSSIDEFLELEKIVTK